MKKFIGLFLFILALYAGYPVIDGEIVGLTNACDASNLAVSALTGLKQPDVVPPTPKPDDKKPVFPHRPHIIFRDGEPAPQEVAPAPACVNGKCQTQTYRRRLFNW